MAAALEVSSARGVHSASTLFQMIVQPNSFVVLLCYGGKSLGKSRSKATRSLGEPAIEEGEKGHSLTTEIRTIFFLGTKYEII